MELDELKEKWAEQDSKLEESLRLNRQILKSLHLNQTRSALQRQIRNLALELVADIPILVALGSFLYEHIGQARFAIPGAALYLFALAVLMTLIRQIVLATQIDYGKPVPMIQKQIEALRILQIRYVQGIFLIATLIWTPLLIVAMKGLFGLDAYKIFPPAWLWGNLLVGLAIIPLAIWLSKRYSARMSRSPFLQGLMRDLAGDSLNTASDFLATLAAFENEQNDR